jgi:hypothetical protein
MRDGVAALRLGIENYSQEQTVSASVEASQRLSAWMMLVDREQGVCESAILSTTRGHTRHNSEQLAAVIHEYSRVNC